MSKGGRSSCNDIVSCEFWEENDRGVEHMFLKRWGLWKQRVLNMSIS